MNNELRRSTRLFAAALGILALCALRAPAEEPMPNDQPAKTDAAVKTPETTIQDWPARSLSEARVMISKYGEPNSFDDQKLTWNKNGAWEKTVIYRKAPRVLGGLHDADVVEQSIAYSVPDEKLADIKRFNALIKFDKATGILSARSGREDLNYLALNLVDEIVTGKRSVSEARDFYRKTKDLSESGKTSPYMDGFIFTTGGATGAGPAAQDQKEEPGATQAPETSGMPDRVQESSGAVNGGALTPPNP